MNFDRKESWRLAYLFRLPAKLACTVYATNLPVGLSLITKSVTFATV